MRCSRDLPTDDVIVMLLHYEILIRWMSNKSSGFRGAALLGAKTSNGKIDVMRTKDFIKEMRPQVEGARRGRSIRRAFFGDLTVVSTPQLRTLACQWVLKLWRALIYYFNYVGTLRKVVAGKGKDIPITGSRSPLGCDRWTGGNGELCNPPVLSATSGAAETPPEAADIHNALPDH
jgi:hypothetical protein